MPLLTSLSAAHADVPDAVSIDGRALSREILLAAATAVADRIAGAPAVAVLATPSLETVVAAVGALLGNVPMVPLPPDSGPDECRHVLRDSGAALLLVPPGMAPADTAGVPVAEVDLRLRASTSYAEAAADSTALIMYTSGTTGAPKGVLLPRSALAADLDALAQAWAWTPEDVLVHGLPLFHVHGLVLGVLGALRVGSKLVHTGKPQPQRYAAAGGTLYFGVPTVWSRLCADEESARALRPARLLVSGSAALPEPVFERLAALTGHRPVERYGMTETLITISTRADGERRPGHVGFPLPGVVTRIVDDNGEALPPGGSIGELQVRGATLFSGYLGRPDATAESHTSDGWFRTGDVATIGSDGWHRIVGRASTDLIKSGGFRIGAGEVENALLAHPAVREAAVVGLPDADLGQRIVAYVVADGVADHQLIDFVARRLSVHKRPRQVLLVPDLPRNPMGKVQKSRLLTEQ